MSKFTPFEKLSKKKKQELMKKRRVTWGSLNPTTRKPDEPKAYKRRKTDNRNIDDNFDSGIGLFLKINCIYETFSCVFAANSI